MQLDRIEAINLTSSILLFIVFRIPIKMSDLLRYRCRNTILGGELNKSYSKE